MGVFGAKLLKSVNSDFKKLSFFAENWVLSKFDVPGFISDDMFAKFGIFGPPLRGWDLWFSFSPSIHASVRAFARQ